jgi:WD40 repeat protein/transcriptional regulator with XRE-family HTH domain
MSRAFYDERDYTFGQAMLQLRTSIGLTQAGLADYLGVSRRAVGEWEAGNSYPKAERLKQLIELGIKQRAFPVGHEAEAIRELWAAAHQKMALDERWLASLLQPPLPQHLPTTPAPREGTTSNASVKARPATSGPLIDWDQALTVSSFYGREQELAQLMQWVLQERCRVVSLLGMGGIGKSTLVVQVMHRLAEHFDTVIFRPLRDAPPCEELLDDCLQVLAPQPLRMVAASLEERLTLLMDHLRTSRTLLVLDNLESLLEEGNVQGHLRPGFEGYERLLRLLAETAHQSCLLLTSREKPAVLRPLEGRRSLVRSLRLTGLDSCACEQLFAENEIEGTLQEKRRLAEAYAGNPLALKIVTETIADLFGGHISQFLAGGTVIFGTIADLLQEQLARLSSLEQTVLYWLAIVREPITFNELLAVLVTPMPQGPVMAAIDSLRRRSLIELGRRQGTFTLQSVVLEYVTTVLIEQIAHEIQQPMPSAFKLFIAHGLEQASTQEYVRQTQERLLLIPILNSLQHTYSRRAEVEEQLLRILDQLRHRAEYAQGYGPANLIALLRLRRGHLRGLNLSHLVIRDAYLRSIEMQDTSLVGATMLGTVFTEALDAIWSVAVSSTGQYWAAGTWRGEVHVWSQEGQRLHLAWQAHTENTCTLAFSPDESLLATGGWDGAVKLWDLQRGALLWTSWRTEAIFSVAFAPDGHMLASSGDDATVHIQDIPSGKQVQTLASQGGAVYSITWSLDGKVLAGGCLDGSIQLWQQQEGWAATHLKTLVGHTNWAHGLAFSPDGTQLASASWDNTVKLWDITSGKDRQTLTGHTQRVYAVAWSPDGHTVASASFDETICLWDVVQNRYRAILHGHTASVHGLAFTPDSSKLVSGSEDSTLRVWDVASGQCIRSIEGYAVSFYDLAWSPDGQLLASAGSDGLVTHWEITNEMHHRDLRGHNWLVHGVSWSPDGQLLASCGWDNAIRIWERTTGNCLQVLQDPEHSDILYHGVAWSPDGQLLAGGTYRYGLKMWDMHTHTLCRIEKTHQTILRRVAWHPDGSRIASGSDDGYIAMWNTRDGALQLLRPAHHGIVASVAWSPDGHLLASAGGGKGRGELFVWNMLNGEREQEFAGHRCLVWAVTWGPGNDQLISGDSDGVLRWWNAQSGQCVQAQTAHQGAVRSVKISPQGQRLASCGTDGTIKLWDLHSGEHLQTLRYERPYERLNITGIRGLTEAQKSTLRVLGAIEDNV